ncbi:hypothetical protein H2248_005761 [Termitomyces sp. 'cryptogamus']|nr:hypothetical protein H2248_005761 [Termitomyces sp. 'cryptogamus']
MDAIPDLAKKTSINSLLNPEASTATSTSTGGGVVPYAPYGVGGPGVDVYGPYVAGSTFGLRAASWGGGGGHGHDDRRKEQARYETADVYGRGREDGYTGMWAGGGPEYGHGAMYSDERTPLVSSQTADGIADSPYARMADNYGYSEQWQLSERASARLVARDSRYASPYYQQPYSPPVQPQPQPQPPTPRVVKRRSPAQDPDQPKQKRAKSASAKTPGPSKRGYPAKKRNDAHIAAQSAKPVTQIPFTSEKGKEKADGAISMRIVPLGPNDPGQALHAEPQSTRCMSTKYKNDPFPRCVACTRRWAGDTCRFQGIRYFLRDATMQIVGVSFSETQKADTPSMKFPKKWNQVLTKAHIDRTKVRRAVSVCRHQTLMMHRIQKTIAGALLPTLRQELAHLRQDKIIHRPREREVRATCDTCMTSLFSSSWLCRLCGREACGDCYSTIHELTYERPGMTSAETQELARRRETHGYANPFFLQCTKRVDHKAADFSPMSRFCREELERAIEEMEGVVRGMEMEEEEQRQNAYGYPAPAPASPTLPTPLAIAPFLPTTLSPLTLSIPTHPIPHYAPSALTPSTFPALWSLGSPLVVVGLLPRFKIAWTPDYFVERYGAQNCLVIECRTEANKRVTVGEFFRAFGRYEGSPSSTAPTPLPLPSPSSAAGVPSTGTRTRDPSTSTHAMLNRTDSVWKLKDWPPSMDFKKAFPELWEDFGNAVPVPSYVRRDGVLNIASHFPEDGVGPDIGECLVAWLGCAPQCMHASFP